MTDVIRKTLSAYVRAGAALVAVLAILALGACGAAEPDTSPAAGTAEAGASAPASTGEAATEDPAAECWSATSPAHNDWVAKFNRLSGEEDVAERIALVRTLPPPAEGCGEFDRATLATFHADADRLAEQLD